MGARYEVLALGVPDNLVVDESNAEGKACRIAQDRLRDYGEDCIVVRVTRTNIYDTRKAYPRVLPGGGIRGK